MAAEATRTVTQLPGRWADLNSLDDGLALSASGVTHRYGRRGDLSLAAIDLEISGHGVTGLVGPNGAGKSTLIKIWAGLERPVEGSARVAGYDSWRERAKAAQHFGYVPQAPALYRPLTVSEHLTLASLERPNFDAQLARDYLGHLRVPLSASGAELSGGQRAQVSLSIALGTRASVLLLDEPLANLDPLARREFLQLLAAAVVEANSLAVLSSHVVSDIEQACDRLIVLGEGRVLIEGTIKQLVATHYVSESDDVLRGTEESVAAFTRRDGMRAVLVRAPGGVLADRTQEGRRSEATLEDIVVGYLTLGRGA